MKIIKMNMIEKIARAIALEHFKRKWQPSHLPLDAQAKFKANVYWKTFEPAAKAVLEALKEPTEGMIMEGSIDPGAWGVDDQYTKECYQSMIQAALDGK